jgi:hypothetical protein
MWETMMRAAHAVAPNLPPPLGERPPTSDSQPPARPKYRRRRRGAPPCRLVDGGLQWRFLHLCACARPRISQWDDVWRIDSLITRNIYPQWQKTHINGLG